MGNNINNQRLTLKDELLASKNGEVLHQRESLIKLTSNACSLHPAWSSAAEKHAKIKTSNCTEHSRQISSSLFLLHCVWDAEMTIVAKLKSRLLLFIQTFVWNKLGYTDTGSTKSSYKLYDENYSV